MRRIWLAAFILFFVSLSSPSLSGEIEFLSSNWGFTGLLELPDARIMEKEMWRPHIRQVHPYRFYAVSLTPFEGLEVTGRITEIMGVKASHDPAWKGYGNYKDKAIDIKLKLMSEEKYLPQISLGFMDPHGTRLYPSQYIVMSKKIHPFDFTIGFGNGRFGKRPIVSKGEGLYIEMLEDPKRWFKDSQFFYGLRLSPSPKWAFVVEYDPTRYSKQIHDPAIRKYFHNEPKSRINAGLSYKPFRWLDLTLAYERGDTIGFGISMPFRVGEPLLPISEAVYEEPEGLKTKEPEERIINALTFLGFTDIRIDIVERSVFIDLENKRYFYLPQAIHAIVVYSAPLLPPHVDQVVITFRENGIPVFSLQTTREDMLYHYRGEIDLREFISLCTYKDPEVLKERRAFLPSKFSFSYKPQIAFYLNDPSGFWKGKVGAVGWLEYRPRDPIRLSLALSVYPLSNVSSKIAPLSIPVRSDVVDYLKERIWLDRFALTFIGRTKNGLYYRLTGGLLEFQYGGIDGEIAKPYLDGRFVLGLSGSLVKKRDPDNPFRFKEHNLKTYYIPCFANLRLNVPELDISADLKAGRFLAGDLGTQIIVSKFIRGVRISAWMGMTNTSVFKDPYNRGYRDKGLMVQIPMRIFEGRESKTVLTYSISPWTRDVAQDIYHPDSLFEILGRSVKKVLDRDLEMVY